MGTPCNDKRGMRMILQHANKGRGLGASRARVTLAGFAILSGLVILEKPARADQAVSCGGAAMAGGAELMCSHVQPAAPPQFCTYGWALMTTAGALTTVQGSFLLPPGASNQAVYQGYGFNSALSNPIVLCQGRKS